MIPLKILLKFWCKWRYCGRFRTQKVEFFCSIVDSAARKHVCEFLGQPSCYSYTGHLTTYLISFRVSTWVQLLHSEKWPCGMNEKDKENIQISVVIIFLETRNARKEYLWEIRKWVMTASDPVPWLSPIVVFIGFSILHVLDQESALFNSNANVLNIRRMYTPWDISFFARRHKR